MIRASSTPFSLGLAAIALAASAATAGAQNAEAARRQYLIPVSGAQGTTGLADVFRGAPSTNMGTPLAFGPAMGDVFIGGSYQNQVRNDKLPNGTFGPDGVDDGAISLGFGIGDATNGIGLATVVTAISAARDGLGDRTAWSFQAFRNVTPTMAVALGVEHAFISDAMAADKPASWYGVASQVFRQPFAGNEWLKAVTLSLGVGNGRFRTIHAIRTDSKSVMAFGSAAALVHEKVSVIGEFTGQDLNFGVSVVPFKKFPIALTPAIADIATAASRTPRFILGAGMGLKF